ADPASPRRVGEGPFHDLDGPEEPKQPSSPNIWQRLGPFLLAFCLFMLAYEAAKEFLWPGISNWWSHIITIIFTTLLAGVGGWVFLTRMERAYRRISHYHAQSLARDRRFRSLVETLQEGVVSLDREGAVTYANPPMARLLGLEVEELAGRKLLDFVAPEDQDRCAAIFKGGRGGEPEQIEAAFHAKNGRRTEALVSVTALLDAEGGYDGRLAGVVNVTHRKQAEEQLRESEELHRLTLATISDAVFTTDLDGQFTFICPNVHFIFGYTREEVWKLGSIDRLLNGMPCDPGELHRAGELPNIEWSVAVKNGELRRLLVTAKSVRIQGGRMLFACRDVTERKQAEEELARREAMLQALIDSLDEAAFLATPDGTVIYANQSLARRFAISLDQLLGRSIYDKLTPLLSKQRRRMVESALHSGDAVEFEDQREGRCFSNRIYPVKDEATGSVEALSMLSVDITRRIRAETALKKSLSEFEIMFQYATVAMLYVVGGRFIYRINNWFEEIFGYSEDEVQGKTTEMLHLSHEAFAEFGEHYHRQLAEGVPVRLEWRLRRKDGEPVWCLISGKAVQPPDIDQGVIWIIDDISEQKELEELKEDVERITRHDLKAPLSGIISVANYFLEEDHGFDDEQIQMLTMLQELGYKMLNGINLSLDIFKMEVGVYDYQPQQVELARVLRQAQEQLRATAETRDVTLDVRPPESGLRLPAEEMLLYTALSNLLTNAVEASPRGGVVTVRVETNGSCRIQIDNLGAPPEEIRRRFFEKYATYGKKGGTGLGAYSARLMVQAMGGQTAAVFGERSTVVEVVLPLEAPEA
ncbi:MAG: PAS domain S-box protein, partial [Desulfovibrionaceae bacterium]